MNTNTEAYLMQRARWVSNNMIVLRGSSCQQISGPRVGCTRGQQENSGLLLGVLDKKDA